MVEANPEIKIILLGESGVGKTNLIYAFLNYGFQENPGCTLASFSFEAEYNYKNKSYTYTIWDTAGQEQYRSINKILIRDSKIILIVYSIDNRKSFNEVDFWIKYVKENLKDDKYKIALVANKNDLYEDDQMVMDEEGKDFAKKYNVDFLITSAKINGKSFQNFVYKLITIYIEKFIEIGNNLEKNKTIKIKNNKKNIFFYLKNFE